jgi:hypothetical protein
MKRKTEYIVGAEIQHGWVVCARDDGQLYPAVVAEIAKHPPVGVAMQNFKPGDTAIVGAGHLKGVNVVETLAAMMRRG